MNILPSPQRFGHPEKFISWRKGQEDAILQALESNKRFVGMTQATGAGKSLAYMTLAKMNDGNTRILTSTRALQDQLYREFEHSDVRGKRNYKCLELERGGEYYDESSRPGERTCDVAPCKLGYECGYKADGCHYFDAHRRAKGAKIAVTNYSYWLSIHKHGEGLGDVETLVLDEASKAVDELAGFLNIALTASDLSLLPRHPNTEDPGEWRRWAAVLTVNKSRDRKKELLRSKIEALKQIDDDWIVDGEVKGAEFAFDPIVPAKFSSLLFQGAKQVIFVSATVRPKTLALLGVDDFDFFESDHTFPLENRRLIHVPCIRLNARTTDRELRRWVNTIDQIIDRRLDRKGIVHTVSYARAKFYMENSRHRGHLITHTSRNTAQVIERFKAMREPAVLVSPATTTGYDFPGDDCRFQVLGKIPYPDTRSKIMKARTERDKDLASYLAMQELVQTCGRAVRSVGDWSENFIVDNNIGWFMQRCGEFAPKWFKGTLKRVSVIPETREIWRE